MTPPFVIQHLQTLGLNETQLAFLRYQLTIFLRDQEYDKLKIALSSIRTVEPTQSKRDLFDTLLSLLETCPDIKTKIALLIEEKTKWEQKVGGRVDAPKLGQNFGEKCRLEIEKYKQLLALEKVQSSKPEAIGSDIEGDAAELGPGRQHPDRTIDRAILLTYAICGSRIKGLDKGKVATAIAFLTGYSAKQITKRFSQVLLDAEGGIKKFDTQTKAWNEDVRIVSGILNEMGLTDEADKLRENSGE